MLKDVLYCPDLGYTLVSLAKCNTAGFTVVLKDKSCCIKDSKGYRLVKYHRNKVFTESMTMQLRI